MKKINLILVLITAILISCNTEKTSYKINGTIKGIDKNTPIILMNFKQDTLATTKLTEGKFSFSGTVNEPTEVYVTYGNPYSSLILENDDYSAAINIEDDKTFQFKGGKLNTLINAYKEFPEFIKSDKALRDHVKLYDQINEEDKEAMTLFMNSYDEKNKVVSDIKLDYLKGIVEGKYSGIEKFYGLKKAGQNSGYSYKKRIELTKEFQQGYETYKPMDNYIASLENAIKIETMSKTVAIGADFKEVIASTKDGETVKLSDVIANNEYTLLEMWASWCGPCRGEFPNLKKAYSHYKNKGFEIYGLSIDEKKDKWLKAEAEEEIPWISVVDFTGFKSKAILNYGVRGIPSSFLISKEGKIVASMNEVRGTNLDDKLKELFSKE
ncbi:TlpA disulfide reductase family protein [Lutibacter citreus]|uniref:TlpA disulfide reductase family protein n=1 Tax=Lutibacter citreus TaxID=2138210 RepID=UPI000DBE4682|nr:TlpA disulfide reductase family protein [Lutibacter citreus]